VVPAHASVPRGAALLATVGLAALALLVSTCTATTPPAAGPSLLAAATANDASVPEWALPEVPVVGRRMTILLAPPSAAPDAGAIRAIAPDPPPLVEQRQWVYDLRYDRGDLLLGGVHRVGLDAPRATPRVMGRFALELYSGPTLIERVRFDFPGLGGASRADEPDGGVRQPIHGPTVSLTAKLTTRIGVMLPATARGTRLELWDRATDRRWPLPWPGVETTIATDDVADAAPTDR